MMEEWKFGKIVTFKDSNVVQFLRRSALGTIIFIMYNKKNITTIKEGGFLIQINPFKPYGLYFFFLYFIPAT